MTIVYNFIFIVFSCLYLPVLFFNGKWHKGFKKRTGRFDDQLVQRLAEKKNIWIHAVSVGEVMAVKNLIERIKKVFPQHRVICSTVTPTGFKAAQSNMGKDVEVIFAPFDLSWLVRRYIKAIRPVIYISAETEIWPNTYRELRKMRVPVMIVNGRISDRTYKNYGRIRFLMKDILACVHCFCMQSEADKKRIIQLGADENKTVNAGNIKFDVNEGAKESEAIACGFREGDRLWVAGSTHRGEEEILLDVYRKLFPEHKDLRLVIVPRHIERADEIARIVSGKGFTPVKYTQSRGCSMEPEDILIVDCIGRLLQFYAAAYVVFVGKSLVEGGGQNMIEPAVLKKPILVGCHTQNFKDIMELFLQGDALVRVGDQNELFKSLNKILKDPELAQQLGSRAKKVVEENRGATQRTLDIIGEILHV